MKPDCKTKESLLSLLIDMNLPIVNKTNKSNLTKKQFLDRLKNYKNENRN
jgi:hypothetical protein